MKTKYRIILLVAVLLSAVVFYLAMISNQKAKLAQLDAELSELLKKYSAGKADTIITKEYLLKKVPEIEELRDRINNLVKRSGLELLGYETKERQGQFSSTFEIGARNRVFYILRLSWIRPFREAPLVRKRPSAKIAIVLDDWGYNTDNIQLLNSIDAPLTISILPNLPYSTAIAKAQISNRNREVILHMPMEPEDEKIRLEKNTLLTTMDKDKILTLLRSSLKTVPYAKGLSNHMGSKATQDEELVRVVMKELRQRGLYFLDSLATPESVCQEEAGRQRLRFAKRDVFLDNAADEKYISSQMDKLIKLARRRGSAIGIGHDRTLTLEVLKEKVKQLSGKDIEFVFVSELVK